MVAAIGLRIKRKWLLNHDLLQFKGQRLGMSKASTAVDVCSFIRHLWGEYAQRLVGKTDCVIRAVPHSLTQHSATSLLDCLSLAAGRIKD
jgi:hypothetical protein